MKKLGHSRSLAAAIVVASLGICGVAAAWPAYAQRANSEDLREAAVKGTDDVQWVFHEQTVERYGLCTVHIQVVNPTAEVRWFIVMEAEQSIGTSKQTDTIYLPYLPPGYETSVELPCVTTYSVGDREVSMAVESAPRIDVALALMAEKELPNSLDVIVKPSKFNHRNMLTTALELEDEDGGPLLVKGIVKSGMGVDQLSSFVTNDPTSPLAQDAGPLLDHLPPAAQLQVAKGRLASPDQAKKFEAQLLGMVPKLCADRASALQLWMTALEDDYATPALRASLKARCAPRPTDAEALAEALDTSPDASLALDLIDDHTFVALRGLWKTTPPTPALVRAFLAETTVLARFAAMTTLVQADERADAIAAVIVSPEQTLHKVRIAWIQTTIAAVTDQTEVNAIATALMRVQLASTVPSDDGKRIVESIQTRAPDALGAAQWQLADAGNAVFDTDKLAAAKVAPAAFLAFVKTNALDGCAETIPSLVTCAHAIDKSGVAGLAPLVKSALKPDFTTSMQKLFENPTSQIDSENELVGLGWDLGFVAEGLCKAVNDTYDTERENALEQAKRFTGPAPCLAAIDNDITAKADAKRASERAMRIAGLLGLILPLAGGAVAVALWWRKRPVPKAIVVEEASTKLHRDARLGAYLGRGLTAGLEQARTDLSIGAIDPAIVEHAAATVKRAVATGNAASLLVRDGGKAVYIVALPVREAHPQIVQRYLGGSWPEHLRTVQQAVDGPVTALVVLCGPDATEATLLVGETDAVRSSDPDVLLGAREARERGANSFQHTITLAG